LSLWAVWGGVDVVCPVCLNLLSLPERMPGFCGSFDCDWFPLFVSLAMDCLSLLLLLVVLSLLAVLLVVAVVFGLVGFVSRPKRLFWPVFVSLLLLVLLRLVRPEAAFEREETWLCLFLLSFLFFFLIL